MIAADVEPVEAPLHKASAVASESAQIAILSAAQQSWAETSLRERLRIVRSFRKRIALNSTRLIDAISPLLDRTAADTLSSEVIPLAEAARYLELQAERLLRQRTLSKAGRPSWLRNVEIVVRREPHGVVLVIGPSNYPLFLPAVQALQALVAGNAVIWKPGAGGKAVAEAIRSLLLNSGLPHDLLFITDESYRSAEAFITAGVDKVVMTGSVSSGRGVLEQCAKAPTPAIVELSGCDSVFVLPGADLPRTIRALLFGLTLNGGATCIAPRRAFVHAAISEKFHSALSAKLQAVPSIAVKPSIANRVVELLDDARARGGRTLLPFNALAAERMSPLVIVQAEPRMAVMRADIFAPVLAVLTVPTTGAAIDAARKCPYALGASVFGPLEDARRVAEQISAGIVVINDIIVPAADPRLSFGGRGNSGFGKTRGAEGLLEMTVSKSIAIQRGRKLRHLEPSHPQAAGILEAYLRLQHSGGILRRLRAAGDLCRAAMNRN